MNSARLRALFGLVAASFIVMVAMSVILGGTWSKPSKYTGLLNSPAAPFRLPDLQGNFVSLDSMRNSIVLLCFAPTPGTDPAYQDARRLADIRKHYGANADVKLVAIYTDPDLASREQQRLLHELASTSGAECITLVDPTSTLAHLYSIEQTPTFFVIDSAGIIRYRGAIDDPSVDAPLASVSFTQMIDLLLAEKPLPAPPTPAVLSNIGK